MARDRKLATWLGSILGTLSALLVLSLVGHASDWQSEGDLTEEFHRVYALAPDGRIALDNMNGAVHIKSWDRNEVQVDAIKRAWNKDRLSEARIEIDASSNSLSIRTTYPEHDQTNWSSGHHHDNPASVEYTLTVPRTARLDEIKLINGSLDVEGLSGEIHASSINGRILARNLSGRLELSTINGALEAQLDRVPDASLELSSVNGSLHLTLPSDARANLEANTVAGSISDDFGLHVARHFVGRSLDGELGGGGTTIRLRNVNGSIEVRHANDNRPLSPGRNCDNSHPQDEDDDSEI